MDLLSEFTQLVDALEASGVEYATCGGLAMAVHGFVRATKDIDLLILEPDLEKAFAAAKKSGFDIEGQPLEFDAGKFKLRRLSKIDKPSGSLLTVDFILVTEHLKDVWEDRELIDWDIGTAWVVSRSGLIKMKSDAGREQDLLDIKNLETNNDDSSES